MTIQNGCNFYLEDVTDFITRKDYDHTTTRIDTVKEFMLWAVKTKFFGVYSFS